ncbi:MAG TPA: molybdopterin-dependent oxidoreductase [Gammaproteobacteria bacterium]|nr:molybdopterin-dependent oxidoreductase [Gammaproteobacteria bacterium]
MTATAVATTCPYCGVGCGILASRQADGAVAVRGDPGHPANFGRLCSKGTALGETLDLEDRLLHPELHGQRVSWDEALDLVAGEFIRIIRAHGRQSVAFYVSGQLLTEDYYVANKLMKGYIGTANIDTNSRLCMSSSVAGHQRAFGADTVPCSYADLELADLLVLVGSNAAWCHPVLWQRIMEERSLRPEMKIVVIDPRRTATAVEADLFLPIQSGTDTMLFNGLLHHLNRESALDWNFLEHHTEGYSAAFTAASNSAPSIPAVAAACGLDAEDVAAFYRMFTRTPRVVTCYSQGVNQSSCGTDKVNSIINCHLATGRIGKPGMGPFSLTGQPNAMGGREVGGLANQLAAHMHINNPDHRERVQRFWNSPVIADQPGLKAVEMFHAIGRGEIKAVWIMATNPVVSLPDADAVRAALSGCELVVVSDCVRHTDTTALAHVLLPALAWGEKDGTVTNSERRISRQRTFLPTPGEAKPDWWIVSEVARRMGFGDAFGYQSAADVFREHAALSACENHGRRDLDLGGLAGIDDGAYDALRPVQWPVPSADLSSSGTARMFTDGRFFHVGGKARLVPIKPQPPAHVPDRDYPLVFNTGRVRDHWHTMTRTGKSARLSAHTPEPYIDVHPVDAQSHGLTHNQLARIESRWGSAVGRVHISATQRPGELFMPMHWNDQYAALARVDAVVNPAVDPHSGQPELKHTPVRIQPLQPAWEAVLFGVTEPPAGSTRWVGVRGRNGLHLHAAGLSWPAQGPASAAAWLPPPAPGEELIEYVDVAAGRYRAALLRDGRLRACVFAGSGGEARPSLEWLDGLTDGDEPLSASDRMALLSGRPPRNGRDTGQIVCSCFGVGRNNIIKAARDGCRSVDDIARVLYAGTNCGSCRAEIRELIDSVP